LEVAWVRDVVLGYVFGGWVASIERCGLYSFLNKEAKFSGLTGMGLHDFLHWGFAVSSWGVSRLEVSLLFEV
jgi:hypothetical protein